MKSDPDEGKVWLTAAFLATAFCGALVWNGWLLLGFALWLVLLLLLCFLLPSRGKNDDL